MNLDIANIKLRKDVSKHCKNGAFGIRTNVNILDLIHRGMCIKALEYDDSVGNVYLTEDERNMIYSHVSTPIAGKSNCSTC